ncbi:hypothetical protein VTI28DRAFT_5910 [Corynascus sepedonium]
MALFHFNPAPFPEHPPLCRLCKRPSKMFITRHSNRKGNAGCRYYKCQPRSEFLCFADYRGNHPDNPPCHCGVSSKKQLTGRETRVSRGVRYVCRLGECTFYRPYISGSGEQVRVDDDDLVHLIVKLRIL